MSSIEAEQAEAAYDALDAAVDLVVALRGDTLSTADHVAGLARLERARRRLPVAEHPMINHIVARATPAEVGGSIPKALANRLHITRGEAARRIADAEVLGPRTTLTGQPLPPLWAVTAAAQAAGQIGAGHI